METHHIRAHIVIGCVDPRAARAAIRHAVSNWRTVSYALDLSNNSDSGEFILGQPNNERNRRSRLRLRTAWELFPEIMDPSLDDDGQPRCSAIKALERQSPMSTRPSPSARLLCWLACFAKAKSAITAASSTSQLAQLLL